MLNPIVVLRHHLRKFLNYINIEDVIPRLLVTVFFHVFILIELKEWIGVEFSFYIKPVDNIFFPI